METVAPILILLLAVVVGGVVTRMLPFPVPAPLVQIGLGAMIGIAPQFRLELDPEVFLLLFLPPLLFLDGWRIPKDEILQDMPTVVGLALGLVLLTVVGMGFFIGWLIPAMPLAVAFALAAVVSPTDPIAVSAIAARVPIPRRMMHILEGEALLNDASGLVCLRFAVAAALTGSFSIAAASLNFVWLAVGGIVVGVALTFVVTRAKARFSKHYGEDAGSQILTSLLIPFGAYLLAETVHCSGILAAVAAGVTMSVAGVNQLSRAATRMRSSSVWDMIQFAANGVIFVLLGEQLPVIVGRAAETVRLTGHHQPWWLAAYVLAIVAGLGLLRFAWVWLSLRFTILRADDRNAGSSPRWRLVAAMACAGVRGAVTLAGVLTLPLVMNGISFPARDLAICLATGVILVSLLIASVALPALLRGLSMPSDAASSDEEERVRVAGANAAIGGIEQAQHEMAANQPDQEIYAVAGSRIIELYRNRIERQLSADEATRYDRIERDLRLAALTAERNAVFAMARRREIGSRTVTRIVREIDLLELRIRT